MILAKLEWAKHTDAERQLDDVSGILQTQGDGLDLEYLEEWVAALGLEEQWNAVQGVCG